MLWYLTVSYSLDLKFQNWKGSLIMLITYMFPLLIGFNQKFCIAIVRMELFIIIITIIILFQLFSGNYFHLQNSGTLNLLWDVKFHLSRYRDCKGHFKGDFNAWPYIRRFPFYLLGRKNGVLFNWLEQLIWSC